MAIFSQEIIELIVAYSDKPLELLTVSSQFQAAVERSNWSSYQCRAVSDIEKFLVYYRGNRCRYIKNIHICMEIPQLTEEDSYNCRETSEELEAHNKRFTGLIAGIFNALSELEERELAHDKPIGICLRIRNPWQATEADACPHRKWNSWRLKLLNPESLPILSSVRTLAINKQT